jgi:hypothetical protein
MREKTATVVKDRHPPTGWTRRTSWLVLSWNRAAPRRTLRLDGFYFVRPMANEAAAAARQAGHVALVLALASDNAGVALPDELFEVAGLEPMDDTPDVQPSPEGDAA